MCERHYLKGERVVFEPGPGVGNIEVEFERDASMRRTEIIIVNCDLDGQEDQGMRVICEDGGAVKGGVSLIEGVDIVGHAEMRG